MRIVFPLFIAFSVLRGYLAFASVKMPAKKRKGRVRIRHRNREQKRNRRASLTKNGPQNWQRATRANFIRKRSGSRSWINAAVAESASRSKIQLEETDEESQLSSSTSSADGTWKTIRGRAIVSSEKLLEKLDESVSCRLCQERVQVMENVATKHGLGSTWRIQCDNESCPSHKTNCVCTSSEKSRAFEINWASVLGLLAIGGGHSAASKFVSFFGLAPINKKAWAGSYKKDGRRSKTFARERIKPYLSWCKRVEVFQRRIKLFT